MSQYFVANGRRYKKRMSRKERREMPGRCGRYVRNEREVGGECTLTPMAASLIEDVLEDDVPEAAESIPFAEAPHAGLEVEVLEDPDSCEDPDHAND